MSKLTAFLFLFVPVLTFAQPKLGELSVEKIMRDPQWIGISPSSPFWGADGTTLYFSWNPEKAPSDSLYYITLANRTPVKATVTQKEDILSARSLVYNSAKNALTYPKSGDIFYKDLKSKITRRITNTVNSEFSPAFSFNDKSVVYMSGQNLFAWEIATGETMQLTNVQSEGESKSKTKLPQQEEWLKTDQLLYMEILKERNNKEKLQKEYNDRLPKNELKKIIVGSKRVMGLNISPDGRYIGYSLYTAPTPSKRTIVPNYITESGFTTDIPGRTKVGETQGTTEFFIYDRTADTILSIKMDDLEGIRDLPDYLQDYPKELQKRKKENLVRAVSSRGSNWSPNGSHLVLDIYSEDSKDRWLVLVDPHTGKLKLLDRQRNEAWVGGPGFRNKGWLDENNFWYQSEASGYSHLYSVNVESGSKKQYTSGKYEVQDAQLSNDKKYFYISTNEVHPGEKQFYRLRIADSKQERVTTQTGSNDITLSPDEKTIAILYSYSNKPWELYLQPNQAGSKAEQITNKAQSEEFKSYSWRDPEVITFSARDGATVYGRLYKPANAKPGMPAVVFVHGAGYLQNAHKWWSSYFREYMFHNLLADKGYYVIDIDYRGSA
ncbi:MAG: DPP IV N-terminal domain-containing protein, partial [Ginsengibacter sp.]